MHYIIIILAFSAAAADFILLQKPPLLLKEKLLKKYAFIAAAINISTAAVFYIREPDISYSYQICGLFLINMLFLMSVTDFREKAVYDIHFYILLAVGIINSLADVLKGDFWRYLFFIAVCGILFILYKKTSGIGIGDIRVISCLVLYFSFARWLEVLLISLGTAMIFGFINIMLKKYSLKTELPFMPFVLAAVLIEFTL